MKWLCKIFEHDTFTYTYNGEEIVKWCWRCRAVSTKMWPESLSHTTKGTGKLWLDENMSYEGVKENGAPAGWYNIDTGEYLGKTFN